MTTVLHHFFSVWRALFLREMTTRVFATHLSWLWLVLEPVLHMAFMIFLFTVIRVRHVGGIEFVIWLTLGLVGFFLFRRTTMSMMTAINANRALFIYRQVKPIDVVLVRAFVEGVVTTLIFIFLMCVLALLGFSIAPSKPLLLFASFVILWGLGIGLGLLMSICHELLPNISKVVSFLMTPMYLLSGVLFPINLIPAPYDNWLFLNPITHAIEGLRYGFSDYYHVAPQLDLAYATGFTIVLLFVGLAAHMYYEKALVTQ